MEKAVLQPLYGVLVQIDLSEPERVPERGRVQHVDVVVGQVELDENLEAAERVLVYLFDGTAVGDQLVQVDQAHRLERVFFQLDYVVVGHVQHLHLVAQVGRYAGMARICAVGHFLSADPFAPAQLRVAHGGPVQFGRGV